jgi:tripartite-type tricarboxylate transporter receptor subunit TctC
MEIQRRRFLHLAAGAAALPTMSRFARAQAYPSRPVRIVVGYAAGGGTDLVARLMGQWLSERIGQQFVIENRTGAATNIGTEAVVRAPGTPYEIIEKLNQEINAGLADPKITARLADLGSTPLVFSPAAFRKFITDEVEKWAKVIRAANIRVG